MLGFIGFMIISQSASFRPLANKPLIFEEASSLWQQSSLDANVTQFLSRNRKAEQIQSINNEINQKVVGASKVLISMSFAS